jgi:Zn ribbon nucleic-acid-binding protein
MRCESCGGALDMRWDNGVVEDLSEDRVEWHVCVECGLERKITLTA